MDGEREKERKRERERGREGGRKEGRKTERKEGRKDGRTEGRTEGRKEGRAFQQKEQNFFTHVWFPSPTRVNRDAASESSLTVYGANTPRSFLVMFANVTPGN